MITLKDGSQGFQREDGKFDVFEFSSNGKFSGMKTVTGQLQVANVKREDTSASTEGSSATEKHLKTLMKTHQCSRAEALKKIKCYKCQKRGHFACDELPVTPRVHRVLSLFYPSYRVNACFHHCTTHTVYNCPTHTHTS